jgi:hypothetical protein
MNSRLDHTAQCQRQPALSSTTVDVGLVCRWYDRAAGHVGDPFDEAANRRLHDPLRPGGTLAVMDDIPDEQPTPRWVALYEMIVTWETPDSMTVGRGYMVRMGSPVRFRRGAPHIG